ncbi:hypothetical protein CsSME_00039143 [Camellia sinensis var. sinensis]
MRIAYTPQASCLSCSPVSSLSQLDSISLFGLTSPDDHTTDPTASTLLSPSSLRPLISSCRPPFSPLFSLPSSSKIEIPSSRIFSFSGFQFVYILFGCREFGRNSENFGLQFF